MDKILPILAVLLGWLLKEISDITRGKIKEKEKTNEILYRIIDLREELGVSIKLTQESIGIFKKSYEQENQRKRMGRKFLKNEMIDVKKNKIEESICYLDPFISNELIKLIRSLEWVYKLEYDEISTDKELYEEAIAINILFQEKIYKELDDILIKISRSHGYLMHKKMKKYLKDNCLDKLNEATSGEVAKVVMPKGFEFITKYNQEKVEYETKIPKENNCI